MEALDASGPAAAARDFYREKGCIDAIPARGPLAALTIPGAVDGWRAAHERHGRLPWETLFAHAINLAHKGIPISRSLADWLAVDVSILQQYPASAGIYLPKDGAGRFFLP